MRVLLLTILFLALALGARLSLVGEHLDSQPLAYLSDLLWAAGLAGLGAGIGLWFALPALLLWAAVYLGDATFLPAMGTVFDYRDLHYLLDRGFITATLGPNWPGLFATLAAGAVLALLLLRSLYRLTPDGKLARPLALFTMLAWLGVVLQATLSPPLQWQNSSLPAVHLDAVFNGFNAELQAQVPPDPGDPETGQAERASSAGKSHSGAARNVLLIVVEGLTGAYLPAVAAANSVQPPITLARSARWADRAWLVPDFITHARQTSRGLYAMLCGDYPKLRGGNPKPMELLDNPVPARRCLPSALVQRGYHTAYYQAANLGFMSKDLVMPFIGFQEVLGQADFPDPGGPIATGSGWGPTDDAFFRQVLPRLKALDAGQQPWFATLLTVGTHYPYGVTAAELEQHGDAKLAAVAAADAALDSLLSQLETQGLLANTLVIVTSDEAHGVPGHWLGQNWGLFFALAPDLPVHTVAAVHAGLDTANSVLDYLGFYPRQRTLHGRSVFRSYPDNRDLLFANTTLKMRDGQGLIHSCTRRAQGSRDNLDQECVTVASASQQLFGDDYHSVEGDFGQRYRDLWRRYVSSEFRFRDHKRWQSMGPDARLGLDREGTRARLPAPAIALAAGSLLTVEMELSYHADASSSASVQLLTAAVATAVPTIPGVALPQLAGGSSLRLVYTAPAGSEDSQLTYTLQAQGQGEAGILQVKSRRYAIQTPEGGRDYKAEVELRSSDAALGNTQFQTTRPGNGKAAMLAPITISSTDESMTPTVKPVSLLPQLAPDETTDDCESRSFSDAEERAIRAYLVYYNRPPDPAGLAFWAARLEESGAGYGPVINAFGTSEEFTRRFGAMDTEALVTSTFAQLFDRKVDARGLRHYADQLKAGQLSRESLALKIVAGAAGSDRQVFENRLQAARIYITAAESDAQRQVPAATLSALLAQVTSDRSSLALACQRTRALFSSAPAAHKADIQRIAHAGGSIDKKFYTNSRQAIEHNLGRGYQWFELDFVWTSDGHLVTLHDWDRSPLNTFGVGLPSIPDLAGFKNWRQRTPYQPLTLEELALLMAQNPAMVLITDVKQDNLAALKLISERIPDHARRVIPQIYEAGEYARVVALGFQRIIWTLYRHRGSNERVLQRLDAMDLLAVTLTTQRVGQGLARDIHQRGIPVLTHTINSYAEWLLLHDVYQVDEVYSDSMAPHHATENLFDWTCSALPETATHPDKSNLWFNGLALEVEQFKQLIELFGGSAQAPASDGKPPASDRKPPASDTQQPISEGQAHASLERIYQALFGRSPADPGLIWWSQRVQEQSLNSQELLLQVYRGASGTDRAIANNRLRVALTWLAVSVSRFSEDQALALGDTLLARVDASQDSIEAACEFMQAGLRGQ